MESSVFGEELQKYRIVRRSDYVKIRWKNKRTETENSTPQKMTVKGNQLIKSANEREQLSKQEASLDECLTNRLEPFLNQPTLQNFLSHIKSVSNKGKDDKYDFSLQDLDEIAKEILELQISVR